MSIVPRVSIGLPVYNGQRYMAQAVESLLAQTFGDFELILCDNASTDETESICRRLAALDSRIRYHRNEKNLGAGPNFNKAFRLTRGKYFKWAAHDDLYEPQYLQRCVEVLDSNPGIVLCHSRATVIGTDGKPIPIYDRPASQWAIPVPPRADGGYPRDLVYDPPRDRLASPDVVQRVRGVLTDTGWCFEIFGLMRSEAVKRSPLHQSFYGSDKVLLLSLALRGRFAEVPEPLFRRRHHPGQSSSRSATEKKSWMDTARKSRSDRLPAQIRCLEWYLRLINHAPLGACQKLQCHAEVARWALWLGRLIFRERHARGVLYRLTRTAREAWGAPPTTPEWRLSQGGPSRALPDGDKPIAVKQA